MSNDIVHFDKDDVLEHFGKKGMKWGVRKQTTSASPSRSYSQKKASRNDKIKTAVKVISIGALVVSGALIAKDVLGSSGSKPISKIPSSQFAASGKDWFVKTNNADAFRITMEEMAKRGPTRINGGIPLGPKFSSGVSRIGGAIPL